MCLSCSGVIALEVHEDPLATLMPAILADIRYGMEISISSGYAHSESNRGIKGSMNV